MRKSFQVFLHFVSLLAMFSCGHAKDSPAPPPRNMEENPSVAVEGEEKQNEGAAEAGKQNPEPTSKLSDITGDTPHSRVCPQFIDASGKLGDYGMLIAANILGLNADPTMHTQTFLKDERKYLLDSSNAAYAMGGSFNAHCPNFPRLSPVLRAFVWSWFFGVLAYEESSCDEESVSYNGAIGLLQMNSWEGRKWRGGPCADPYADMKNGFDNVSCGLWIMKDIIKGFYPNAPILGNGSYWEPLYSHWSQEWTNYFPKNLCFSS